MAEHELSGICWLLDEGTPGHRTQSEGVIKLLQESGWALEVHKVTVRNRLPGFLRPAWRWLLPRVPSFLLVLLRWCACELGVRPAARPDFVISSGGKSAFASFAIRKKYQCANIFVGVPDPFSDLWFDLVISPVERAFKTKFVVSGIIPNTVSPASVLNAGGQYWEAGLPERPCWALMIGGTSKSHRYQDTDWHALIEGISALARRYDIKWLISTSRRTPQSVERLLAQELDSDVVQELVLYNQEPKKILLPFLYMAEQVFITQDSLTMASEAFNSGKAVTLLAPKHVELQPGSFFEEMIYSFPALPNIARVPIEEMSGYIPQPPSAENGADFTVQFRSRLSAALKDLL